MVSIPGHSPGYLSFWRPERWIVLCGEVMVRRFGGLRLPFSADAVGAEDNKRSVRKLAELGATTRCFGGLVPR